MRYECKNCTRIFFTEEGAMNHRARTSHKVELLISSTFWGKHLATITR